jgi:hypothetical protein
LLRLVRIEHEVHFLDADPVGEQRQLVENLAVCRQVSQPSVCVKNTSRTGRDISANASRSRH